jgi:hypothetical protein
MTLISPWVHKSLDAPTGLGMMVELAKVSSAQMQVGASSSVSSRLALPLEHVL